MKEQIESRLCESLRGRVVYNSTRYRGSHDKAGRSWITFDNEIIHDFCTVKLRYEFNIAADRIREDLILMIGEIQNKRMGIMKRTKLQMKKWKDKEYIISLNSIKQLKNI
ncbi:SF0329 family protein [Fontibacillus panacisegetis]